MSDLTDAVDPFSPKKSLSSCVDPFDLEKEREENEKEE